MNSIILFSFFRRKHLEIGKATAYPPFGFDVLHLVISTLADPLAAPKLHSDLTISIAHSANGQEIRQDG